MWIGSCPTSTSGGTTTGTIITSAASGSRINPSVRMRTMTINNTTGGLSETLKSRFANWTSTRSIDRMNENSPAIARITRTVLVVFAVSTAALQMYSMFVIRYTTTLMNKM